MAKRTVTASRSSKPSKPNDALDALLRGRGLRRTMARITVLRFMHANRRPMSHGDVAQGLEADGLDRATVYRNLMDLVEVGILMRTDVGDHVWRFELKRSEDDDETEHPHFICTDCGGVSCLPDGVVKLVSSRRSPKAVNDRRVVVQLRGICDACA